MAKIDRTSMLIYLTLLVNIFDVVLHVGIGQPEALRITGNVFIIISSILLALNSRYQMLFTFSICAYILLNTSFVVLFGIGIMGAVLIATTTLTGMVLVRRRQRTQHAKPQQSTDS